MASNKKSNSDELKDKYSFSVKIDPSLIASVVKVSMMTKKVIQNITQNTKKSVLVLSKLGTIAKGLGNSAFKGITKLGSATMQAGKNTVKLASYLSKVQKQNATKNIAEEAKKSASGLGKLGTIAKGLGNLAFKGVTKLASGIMQAGKNGVKLASDLSEVQRAVDTTFGKNATQINQWSKTALNAYGLNELSAKKYTSTLGVMLQSNGITGDSLVKMSEKLTGLSGDFASFSNISQDDAFEKIRSGIAGDTESLKELGINMSSANLDAYALSKGITKSYEELDEAGKTTLRYSYLMSTSKKVQGDFAKNQGSFANQIRLLKANFDQLALKIMNNVLPSLTKLVQTANNFISNIDINKIVDIGKKGFKYLGDSISWVKDNINWLLPIAGGLISALAAFSIMSKVKDWLNGATLATKLFTIASNFLKTSLLTNPIFWIAAALGVLVAAFMIAYKHNEKFRVAVNNLLSKISQFGQHLLNTLIPALKSMYEWFKTNILPVIKKLADYFMQNVYPILKQIASTVVGLVVVAFKNFSKILTDLWNNVIIPLSNFFTSVVLPILKFVGGIVLWLWKNVLAPLASFITSVFKGAFEVAIPFIADVFSSVFSSIGQIIDGATKIFTGLIDFITGVFTGNWQKAWQGVKSVLSGIWEGLGGIMKAPINLAIDAVNALINGFNKVASVDIPIVGKLGITIPEIPKFALGGIANQPSIFGEAGPEMAIPLKRSPRSFELLNRAAQILGVGNHGYSPGSLSMSAGGQQPIQMPKVEVNVIVNEAKSSKESISAMIKESVESAVNEIMEAYFSKKERLAYGE